MIVQEHINSIYVTDQERAKNFYTKVLGYTLDEDRMLNENFRWISVIPPGQPENKIALFSCDSGVGVDTDTAEKMRSLVEQSAFSVGALRTADCYEFCERLKAHNVTFLVEPGPRDWGVIEAIILDDSGNRLAIMSLIKDA